MSSAEKTQTTILSCLNAALWLAKCDSIAAYPTTKQVNQLQPQNFSPIHASNWITNQPALITGALKGTHQSQIKIAMQTDHEPAWWMIAPPGWRRSGGRPGPHGAACSPPPRPTQPPPPAETRGLSTATKRQQLLQGPLQRCQKPVATCSTGFKVRSGPRQPPPAVCRLHACSRTACCRAAAAQVHRPAVQARLMGHEAAHPAQRQRSPRRRLHRRTRRQRSPERVPHWEPGPGSPPGRGRCSGPAAPTAVKVTAWGCARG